MPLALIAAVTITLRAGPGEAQTADAAADACVPTVTIVVAAMSNMTAASAGDVNRGQLASQPLLRPAAVLENVPGLIVTQHSGEGKANQYFLRAFNLDHGTDLATEVDDLPVNMPTHAHGQGYTDLTFLIPELFSDLYYMKGPNHAEEGEFAPAGAVRIELTHELPDSITLSYGRDGVSPRLGNGLHGRWGRNTSRRRRDLSQ